MIQDFSILMMQDYINLFISKNLGEYLITQRDKSIMKLLSEGCTISSAEKDSLESLCCILNHYAEVNNMYKLTARKFITSRGLMYNP